MLRFASLVIVLALFALARPAGAQEAGYGLLPGGGAGGWLNVTRPLTANDMRGRLVLLDFWTYGCINCQQIVPDLEYLEKTFGDRLLIIGVHSAKFAGEKGSDRILAAAKRFGLKHPVINDSDFRIWNSFGVRTWPTQVLLDGNGTVIGRYIGEGHRQEIEKDIQAAIKSMPMPQTPVADLVAATEDTGILHYPARLTFAEKTPWGAVMIIADTGHHRIVVADETGLVKAVIGSGQRGARDGTFADAQFNNPRGIALIGDDLYIADTGNHKLRVAHLQNNTVETMAGTGKQGRDRRVKDVAALKADLASPWDVEVIDNGRRIAITMAGLHQLWAYDVARQTVSVIAGTGVENIEDGPAHRSALAQPSGLSAQGDDLFFVDAETSSLRVLQGDGTVKTLIGTGLFDFGLKDGQYPDALMQHAQGLFAGAQEIVVADTYNNTLRVYDRGTGALRTVPLSAGTLHEPGDVVVHDGTTWISDTNGQHIVKVNLQSGEAVVFPLKMAP